MLQLSRNPKSRSPRASPAVRVAFFLAFGVLQTLFALALFQRADDHAYFLEIADAADTPVAIESGIEEFDLKVQAASTVFHALTAPSRWLGGGEVAHLVWLRLLTLAGFLAAFEWVRKTLRPESTEAETADARKRFMILCLLYPGQLAWTASLLRDGPACAMLFCALLAWSSRRYLFAAAFAVTSLALRPEFALVITALALSTLVAKRLDRLRHRRLWLALFCGFLALLFFAPRQASSEFGQSAFVEGGFAYPAVTNPFDVGGYLLVLAQALVDPISLTSLSSPSPFFLAEAAFFAWLVWSGWRRLPFVNARAASLLSASYATLWVFAYFEIFVSGFSRHRLALVVLLIAVHVLTNPRPARATAPRRGPPPAIGAPDRALSSAAQRP